VIYAQDTRKSIFLQETNAALSGGEGTNSSQLDRESVVMAAGGARGITAELLKALAKHYQPHLYLLGSNPLHSYPDEIFAGSDEEFAKRRPFYIREQRTQHPEKSLAAINKAFERMIEARAARKNMSEMAQHCGKEHVHYIACDVTNRDKLAQVVTEIIQTEGKVDLLINAAGLNSSTPIREKKFKNFRSIRDIKVKAYQNLKNAFKERQPRLWCNFGSLIALSGQIGEVDYASANDFLVSASTYASHLSRVENYNNSPPAATAEFTICWTLWGAVGMGANPLIKAYFERIDFYSAMTTEEGIYHFMREINQPQHVPAIIHIGEAEKGVFNDYLPGFIDACTQTTKSKMGFYLDRVLWSKPGANSHKRDEVVFERILDLKRDSYLNNHLVNGYATLPGTFVTEIAAEAATQLLPGMHIIAFEDIQFKHFLRLYNEDRPCTKRVHAKIIDQTDEQAIVQIRILTDIVSPDGKTLKRNKEHFESKVILRHEFPPAPYWENWESINEIPVPDPYHATTSPVVLTNIFVSTKDTRLHPQGKRASYSPKLPTDHPIFSRFLMPTILLDGLARVGALDLVEGEYIPLIVPISIRRLDLYEKVNDCQLVAQSAQIELYVTPRELTHLPGRVRNRFVAAHPDGKILLQFKDAVSTLIGYLHRDTKQFFPPEHLHLAQQGIGGDEPL
jgi:NAD(P)-dependent dehydrogenase (short-subunit alcohol dehydrogenase family)